VDFEFSARTRDYLQRLGAFMDEHIYPNEERFRALLGQGDRWLEPPLLEPQARSIRLADGPDEVHRNQIGRLELDKYP
jgi:hypothetical protein